MQYLGGGIRADIGAVMGCRVQKELKWSIIMLCPRRCHPVKKQMKVVEVTFVVCRMAGYLNLCLCIWWLPC